MKKLMLNLKYVLICTIIVSAIFACSKDDDNTKVTPIDNIVGEWDGTDLFLVMNGTDYNIDDLIEKFSNAPTDETEDAKTKREKLLESLKNHKELFVNLFKIEFLENGTGTASYEGHSDWDDKATWTKKEDGKYEFIFGEGEYRNEAILTIEDATKGFFVMKGESTDTKVIIEKIKKQ